MSRDDAVLLDILIAARRAVEFASGVTREQLGSDLKTQSAILHQLLARWQGEIADTLGGVMQVQPVQQSARETGGVTCIGIGAAISPKIRSRRSRAVSPLMLFLGMFD